jgi:putative membrane protein
MTYAFLKACHVLSMIAWMAGMLYLPRLFVYHAAATNGSETSETFKVMERRLLRGIMNPAMIATWIFGLALVASNPTVMQQGWIHVKLLCVIIMTVLHMVFARWRKQFAADANTRSPRFYRIWNEMPALLLVVIVVMAVVKPF